jgi:hypothetical protein
MVEIAKYRNDMIRIYNKLGLSGFLDMVEVADSSSVSPTKINNLAHIKIIVSKFCKQLANNSVCLLFRQPPINNSLRRIL